MSTAARLLVFVAACGALSAAQHSELQTELNLADDRLQAPIRPPAWVHR